ncbi:hypothetical protein BS47DRAFT_127566 [Hydnum rufescens UP504]|uniref:Uncharacterized protein n=1 Tax=Hydnum rufescens UP504 TaxID=1448309 RepID=A0A9P6APW2_9AGAM|nr:hypothetical protein BS47DRAFT_127566 [Hydnum rufescens UP504]
MSIGQDIDTFAKSAPTSPLTSKDKDKDKGRAGKPRSGSVSMLQRAAGALVRKKSEEKVKEKDRDKEKDDGGDPGKMSVSRPSDSTSASFSSLSSPSLSHSTGHASGSNKLTKSPPSKGKDRDADEPPRIASVLTPGSPWVAPSSTTVHPLPSRPSFKFMQAGPSSQPNDGPQLSALNTDPDHTHSFAETEGSGASKGRGQRASILHTFRTWFQEDKKKKTKPVISPLVTTMNPYFHVGMVSSTPLSSRSGTYRSGRKKGGGRRHDKRASISSHRSSSVNSRRSSVTSIQQKRPAEFVSVYPSDSMPSVSRQRSDASRLSFGSRTPTSEMGSRPSSIRSFKVTSMGRHSRRANSPSQSSMGSGHGHRTASPLQHYHRRVGSGSSGRVIRQIHTVHQRSNSAASSTRSVSRPGSFSEVVSDTELGGRASPLILDKKAHTTTVFVAHKQGSVFGAPSSRGHSTVGRSSWKKSWGVEPPGWSSRTSHAAGEIETLSDPGDSSTVRDVFTGRQSLDPNDDSDWVDEDDDIPAFVGGLGQLPAVPAFGLNTKSSSGLPPSPSLSSRKELPLIGNTRPRSAKRTRPVTAPSNMSVPSEIGRSSTLRSSPTVPLISLAADHGKSPSPEPPHSGPPSSGPRARRQLPSGRSGPSFRHAIQEEDEGEEE